MVLLGLELEDNPLASDFMQRAEERTKTMNLKNNPYTDYEFRFLKKDSKAFHVWNFKHIWPDFSVYFILVAIVGGMLFLSGYIKAGIIIWVVSGLIVSINMYGRSKYFNFFVIRLQLRRSKYKGLIRLLSTKEIVKIFPAIVLKGEKAENGSS
jgi:hypothetical protein